MGMRFVCISIVFLLFLTAIFTFPVHADNSNPSAMAGDADPLELVATITLDNEPMGIAVNEETNLVYVSTKEGLIVIDGETNEIVTEIPLPWAGLAPAGSSALAVNPQTNRIYVGRGREKAVVIDGATNSVVGQMVSKLYESYEIAVNPVMNLVYIAYTPSIMNTPDSIEVYDGETLRGVASVDIPGSKEHPYIEQLGVAVNPRTNRIYAVWSGNGNLYVVDGSTYEIIKQVKPPSYNMRIMVNPYTNYVYVGNVVLDGDTLGKVADYPSHLGTFLYPQAVDMRHNILYFTYGDTLYVVYGDTHKIVTTMELNGKWIYDVAVNTKTGKIYLNHRFDNDISVVRAPSYSPKFMAVVSDLAINPAGVEPGETVVVAVRVTNIGELAGFYTAVLKINGAEEAMKEVELAGGESTLIEFPVAREVTGEYTVNVDGATGVFVVAEFVISDLSISPAKVGPEEVVAVSVNVANPGEVASSRTIDLKIDGIVVDTKTITLAGGESKTVIFEVSKEEPGTYEVEINGQRGTITVRTPPSYAPYGVIAVAVIIGIVVFAALRKKR